jgi:DNA polymerase III subunit gamma/tau
MGQALYRKNRPKKLSEVVGQDHITSTLANAIKKGSISHAYLFTGPKGVGKTSVARILAHEINSLQYTDDSMHLDIIEIDAASNRRIDEIRELRERANIAPVSAKYKVYIIDEVHMLTREAFNALLKTLEEPPAHVVFILATTEAHKLPETIVSRTQRFTFKPIATETIKNHLDIIAKQENIDITEKALWLIARHGDGSFRDSISLLDQIAGINGKIGEEYVLSMLGIPSEEVINELVKSLDSYNAEIIIRILNQLEEQGITAAQTAKQLGIVWRQKIITQNNLSQKEFDLLEKLLNVPSYNDPQRYLEIILLEYALVNNQTPVEVKKPESVQAEKKSQSNDLGFSESKIQVNSKSKILPKTTPKANHKISDTEFYSDTWPKVLTELKKKHNTLYGVVRMAQPSLQNNRLMLEFAFAFHRKRLSEPKNQNIITTIIKDLTGQKLIIECKEGDIKQTTADNAPGLLQTKTASENIAAEIIPNRTDITSISNIFGGGELLES